MSERYISILPDKVIWLPVIVNEYARFPESPVIGVSLVESIEEKFYFKRCAIHTHYTKMALLQINKLEGCYLFHLSPVKSKSYLRWIL